ncbi:hypothetical protein PR003_g10312 [Phytophthora rubi]|uniref:Uncharacterized protein n=2 Tax=Phytophthora rubi TaxID=129364 RepID=A0A6A4F612_9STRA|nr:hypothetical protein PR003_g10312 [Phytophthora rubi]
MVAGSTTSRSPSRSPPPVATAEELRQLNSTLRSRLARSVTDLEVALVSRDAALYDARQAEVVRLRGEIAAYQDTENPNLPLSPTVVNSPESSPAPPAKRRVAPLSPDAGGSSGSAEGDSSNPVDLTHDDEPHADNGAVSDGGGHADDSGSEASHQSSTKKGSAADSDNDDDACDENDEDDEGDEDTAEVSDELFKAQTLKALAQSRSAERRRRQASPRHGPKVAGSRASPDGSDDSDSNEDPAPRSASRAGSSAKLPASSRRRPSEPSGPMSPGPTMSPRPTSHEAESLQSYWESTHSFSITHAMVKKHPWLAVYCKERNNRRSHAGNRWKAFLELLILAMREGWCDLDLLLDPFFLHFPKRSETVTWFPGLAARQANLADPNLHRREPVDLLAALDEDNSVDPWRNHYRDLPQQHPANSLSRLTDKFFGVQGQDAE